MSVHAEASANILKKGNKNMKLVRPLKCVITAAAVCILCFSGNGEYIYAVFALTPENDIVDLEMQPDDNQAAKNNRKNSENSGEKLQKVNLKRIVALYGPNIFLHNDIVLFAHNECQPDIGVGWKRIPSTLNEVMNELFEAQLHGNRSP